jgi:hypothetical protein
MEYYNMLFDLCEAAGYQALKKGADKVKALLQERANEFLQIRLEAFMCKILQ